MPFGPLLAKCVLVTALFSPIVFGVLYPERKTEADAYENASRCAFNVADSSNCRAVTDAVFVDAECHDDLVQHADDFCEARFTIAGADHFIGLDRQRVARLIRGERIRVEWFRRSMTAVEIDGRLVQERGSPKEAAETLVLMLKFWTVLGIASAVYLYRKRQKT